MKLADEEYFGDKRIGDEGHGLGKSHERSCRKKALPRDVELSLGLLLGTTRKSESQHILSLS